MLHSRLVATEAVLHEPDIKVEIIKKATGPKKMSLYGIFSMLDDNFQLEELRILKGRISYKPSPGTLIQLNNVNAGVNTRSLLKAGNISDIGEALDSAYFRNATFSTGNLKIAASGVRFKGDGSSLNIQELQLKNRLPLINMVANGVRLNGLAYSDSSLSATSINWQKANIDITTGEKQSKRSPSILWRLEQISGKNTAIKLTTEKTAVKAWLDEITFPLLGYSGGHLFIGPGARITGSQATLSDGDVMASGAGFDIRDNAASVLSEVSFQKTTGKDSILVRVPEIKWEADLSSMASSKQIDIRYARLLDPEITYISANDARRLSVILPGGQAAGANMLSLRSIHADGKNWSAFVDHLKAADIRVDNQSAISPSLMRFSSFGMDSLFISSGNIKNRSELLLKNDRLVITDLSAELITPRHLFTLNNFTYNNRSKSATIGNVSYNPAISRDSFVAAHPFQSDYIQTKAEGIIIQSIDLPRYFQDDQLTAQRITISRPDIRVFRDKRLPFQSGIIKPLPTDMILNIPLPMSIDTVRIEDGRVSYTELYGKTQQEGAIFFTRLNASLFPFKNFGYGLSDSLHIKAIAYLMDSAWVKLLVQQAYTDSLAGFIINARMKPADLTILNPMLMPAASAMLVSGQLDTLDMKAIATDQLALGKMKMLYHHLKLSFFKNGDENNKNFLTGLASFAANKIIKRNNKRKAEPIFFPRNRDRSVFNYWVKMAMSGAIRSAGIRKNTKEMRRHKKLLKKLQVPEINF